MSFAPAGFQPTITRKLALGDKSVHLHFDKDAQQMFNQFRMDLAGKVRRESNPGKRSHLSKYEGGLAKIAALLQLVDTIAALPETPRISTVNMETGETKVTPWLDVPQKMSIDQDHLQRALNLLTYLEAHMVRVYDSKLEGVEYRKVRLLEHLKDGSIHDGMTANEILHKGWAGLSQKITSSDAIQAALEELVDLGWVRPIPVKPGTTRPGKPTVRWEVNPE